MKVFITIARIIVGVLFIFSGLVKANDPLGLSYKMQEFFEVWNIHFLDHYTLAFSIVMIAFEIVAGVAVLVGWQMRIFIWLLLLLMIFFTFLTGYAYLSGKIRECGCFGDCIPLSAGQSFNKDIFLMILIIPIFLYRNRIRPAIPARGGMIVLFFAAVFSFALQWYTLQHLPVVDCLPYKQGASINEGRRIPPGAVPDSTVISFVYTKNGAQVEFTADHFPADYNDSVYKFVRRYDKLVRKGNAEPAIKDFSLEDSSGQNVTESVLADPHYKLFLFIKDKVPTGDWQTYMAMIWKAGSAKEMGGYVVTNLQFDALPHDFLEGMRPLRCDVTAIKTAARANPTLYLLNGDRIIDKWGYADFEQALQAIRELK